MSRYARQIAVPGVGAEGQSRIGALSVEVEGEGLAAEICALYLAGAGVKQLAVCEALVERVRALNSEVELVERAELVVCPEAGEPVEAGSRAARWVLARALGGVG
jgi:sulfur-carrier protein adenylyltransferase/sulfurtransferase